MKSTSVIRIEKGKPEASYLNLKGQEGKIIQGTPFSPDIPLNNPILPWQETEDNRDPIDEPFLPEDPGDEPEDELRKFQHRHLGEFVKVRYQCPRGPRNAQGTLKFGWMNIVILTESRIYRIRRENVIRIQAEGDVWTRRN